MAKEKHLTSLDFTASHSGSITRRNSMLTVLGSALALAGCGGGGGAVVAGAGGGAAGGATSALTVGQITGFGSIILNGNGVRIDDSSASISDDDGNDLRGRLRLGMCVAVVTASNGAGNSVAAQSIISSGELQGRIVGAPNTAQNTFVVMGQTVKVVGATVFDTSLPNGFASLATDTIVEVHGQLNANTNVLKASFIEKKTAPAFFKIQGFVSNHNASTRKFNIGPILINYANATELRLTPANGLLVRVRLTAVLPPLALPAEWLATRVRGPEHLAENRGAFEIEGGVTSFTSSALFSVNGVPVDASTAVFERGTAASIALGVRVEVKGSLVNGMLIATRVKLEDDNELDEREFELHGSVANLTATTFTLRGVTVEYGAATLYRRGTVTNLVNGAQVEVKGVATTGTGAATRILATRISFES